MYSTIEWTDGFMKRSMEYDQLEIRIHELEKMIKKEKKSSSIRTLPSNYVASKGIYKYKNR